jgi:hypothetical protein
VILTVDLGQASRRARLAAPGGVRAAEAAILAVVRELGPVDEVIVGCCRGAGGAGGGARARRCAAGCDHLTPSVIFDLRRCSRMSSLRCSTQICVCHEHTRTPTNWAPCYPRCYPHPWGV